MKKEFVIISLIVLIIVISGCSTGEAGRLPEKASEVSFGEKTNELSFGETTCFDSDGGKNYAVKGNVTYECEFAEELKQGPIEVQEKKPTKLPEPIKKTRTFIGRAMEMISTQPKTEYVKIEIEGKAYQCKKVEEDSCNENKEWLLEYYCDNGKLKADFHNCGEGEVCEDGKCVKEDLSRELWQSMNGPPGAGRVTELIQNPNSPYELYAAIEATSQIYKSVNKGNNWQIIEDLKDIGHTNSIAVYKDKLFTCGPAVFYYDKDLVKNLVKIKEGLCNKVIVSNDKLFVTIDSEQQLNPKIFYDDLTAEGFNWVDISPSESELKDLNLPSKDMGFWIIVKISNLLALENRILANVIVEAEGSSGEFNNGLLYVSENLGQTWSKVDLDVPDNVVIGDIVQDPKNPNHILLTFIHPLHEIITPISKLLRESFDGGKTWKSVTNLELESNGFIDGSIVESAYYLIDLRSGLQIFKLKGSSYEIINMPKIDAFKEMEFNLHSFLLDPENPNIVYGKTNPFWEVGLVKSEDGMKTWKKMDRDIVVTSPTIVVPHPTDPNTVFTSSNIIQESYATRDGGKTWEPFTPVNSDDEIIIDPHNPNHILTVSETTGLYESNDAGKTFNPINKEEGFSDFSSARIFDFEMSKSFPKKIYVSNLGTGISQSKKFSNYNGLEDIKYGGWYHLSSSPDYAYDIEIDPDNEDIIYASYSPKIFEDYSAIWKYDPNYWENFGWKEILKVEKTKGITSLEFDKVNSNNLYAGVIGKRGMIYASNNKGDSWNKLNEDLTFSTIHAITIDPNNQNIVYAAPWGGGLFKSTDNGKSWTEVKTPTISIPSIIVDPKDSNHLIIADRTKPKIYESFNSGQSWSELVALDENNYYRISTMALHKGELYFSAFNQITGMISLFVNGPMSGTTFKLVNGKPVDISGKIKGNIIIDFFSDNNNLFAVNHIYGIHKWDGNDWADISPDLNLGFNNIIVDGNDFYLAGGADIDMDLNLRIGDNNIVNNIYKSSDGGNNWSSLLGNNPFNSGIKKLLQHPTNKNILFAATGTGVYVSVDKGETWSAQNNDLNFKNIGSMTVGNNYIYVGTLGGGVYTGVINQDYSITWSDTTGPYPEIYNIQIRVDPKNSNAIYATSYPGGVFKSSDAGKTWGEANFAMPSFKVDNPNTQGYYSLEIDPNNPNILYLGIFGKGVYKSTDGAATWIPMYGNMGQNKEIMKKGITQIKVNPVNSNHVYLATNDGVYFSDNGAESWKSMNKGLQTLDIKSLKIVDNLVCVGTAGYSLYYFNPSEVKWKSLARILGFGWWTAWDRRMYQFSTFLFDSDIKGRVYYGNFPGGFFISEDNGHTWKDSSLGLGNDGIFSLSVNPQNHDILWAGTYNGISKSIDRGKTWVLKGKNGVEDLKQEDAWNAWNNQVKGIIPPEQWPYTIAIDGNNPKIMYISTKNGRNKGFCYRNCDESWGIKTSCDRQNFCGIVMKSTDGGETWFEIMKGLDWGSEFYNLIIYPPNHNILFMSTNKGVYMSKDAGDNWEEINEGLPTRFNQVRDNVANNLALTSNNKYLILGLKNYGAWKANLKKLGLS
ncbi:MAG: hypothetical protein ABH824_07650 [Nanoarchaeota archaeon]|nr:hypothetical protein [Nanoarchaeota archaeon]MBU1631645.1 hypothetical protein [Nanoarchaeota archaeon]MBU1875658.1 hypothetical protein [Nanoarchaeota archaeon]